MKIYHRQGPLHFSEEGEEIFRLICCGTISCRVLITSFLLFLMLTKDAVKTNSNYLSKQTNQKIYNFFATFDNSRVNPIRDPIIQHPSYQKSALRPSKWPANDPKFRDFSYFYMTYLKCKFFFCFFTVMLGV